MMKTVVFEGEKYLGEVEIINVNNKNNNGIYEKIMENGIKISKHSKGSERCTPLSVLHTITRTCNGVCFKIMESSSSSNNKFQQQDSQLFALYTTCLRDNKTAVMPLGEQEIHLVAIRSRRMDTASPCFWGFSVIPGLYESCLGMLNLRCLGIVFDLDETLIVANTLRSFEDRIEALQRKINVETDHQRIECMIEEVKRYQEDKAMLKQYAETDQVVDNGKVHKCEAEVIPALSDDHQTVVRPLIRLQDKNIVLTRINPQIRDTSVLVRLRPAWEDLRSYLTARGRKRFEVYVCTMAERDYALEMWRLLDPDSNLISGREILERIVCVKSGSKKSLFNVFHGGICDPKMALVIDDRLKVWDEKDQPRVHVVPAFAPYYAPQAEANNTIPVLCMARNVACNVRGGFFKEFDDCLLQRISEVSFEDDPNDILPPPDVSNFLVSEDEGSGCNGNKESIAFDGMGDAEIERRLKGTTFSSSSTPLSCAISTTVSFESRLTSSHASAAANSPMTISQPTPQASFLPFHNNLFRQAGPLSRSLGNIGQDLGLLSSSAREEGEVPESDLDPDIRRRLLILQHGQDIRENLSGEPPFQVRPAVQAPVAGPGPIPAPVAGPVTVPDPTPVTVPGLVPGPGLGSVSGLAPHRISVPGPSPVPVSRVQSRGSWFPVEDHMNLGPMSRLPPKDFPMDPDGVHVEKHRPLPPFPQKVDKSGWSDRPFSEKQRLSREAPQRDDRLRSNYSFPRHNSLQGDEITLSRSASSKKDFEVEPEQHNSFSESPSVALNDIAIRCGAKVEFKLGLVATQELKFSMEVYFAGEKIGDGTGTTRKEAQHNAAEAAMMNLADRYLTHIKSETSTPKNDTNRGQSPSDMGFVSDAISQGDHTIRKEETALSSEVTGPDANHVDDSKNSIVLKELCLQEDLDINFKGQPLTSTNPVLRDDVLAEVKINEPIRAKGTGLTSDEIKLQVVEGMTSKRLAPEYPQVLEHMPSLKCPRNASPVP